MELVDASVNGEINAQWGEGCHFWFGILQWDDDDKRQYTWGYECCGPEDECGNNESETYNSLDELFSANSADGFTWHRCKPFPDLSNTEDSRAKGVG